MSGHRSPTRQMSSSASAQSEPTPVVKRPPKKVGKIRRFFRDRIVGQKEEKQ